MLAYLIGLCFIAVVMVGGTSNSRVMLSEKAKGRITAVVGRESSEPIHSITRQDDGSVLVETELREGPSSGGANMYRLKHSLRGWYVAERFMCID